MTAYIDLYNNTRHSLRIVEIFYYGAIGYLTAPLIGLPPSLTAIYMVGVDLLSIKLQYLNENHHFKATEDRQHPMCRGTPETDVGCMLRHITILSGVSFGGALLITGGATNPILIALVAISTLSRIVMFFSRDSSKQQPNIGNNWLAQGVLHSAVGYFVTGTRFFPVIANAFWAPFYTIGYMLTIHTLNSIGKFIINKTGGETLLKWALRHTITVGASALLGSYLVGWTIVPTLILVATSLITRLGIQLCNGNKIAFSQPRKERLPFPSHGSNPPSFFSEYAGDS